MKKYQLYYLDCLIADFSVDGNEVITYIPNEDVIKEFDNVIFAFLKIKFNCPLKDVPFINSRVNYMLKFDLNELKYETDNYKIKMIF